MKTCVCCKCTHYCVTHVLLLIVHRRQEIGFIIEEWGLTEQDAADYVRDKYSAQHVENVQQYPAEKPHIEYATENYELVEKYSHYSWEEDESPYYCPEYASPDEFDTLYDTDGEVISFSSGLPVVTHPPFEPIDLANVGVAQLLALQTEASEYKK